MAKGRELARRPSGELTGLVLGVLLSTALPTAITGAMLEARLDLAVDRRPNTMIAQDSRPTDVRAAAMEVEE